MIRIILIAVLIMTGILYSCTNDNIITNNEDPVTTDTVPRYEWRMKQLLGNYFLDMHIVDTSNIYITSRPDVLKYDGNSFTPVDLGFQFDANNIGSYDNINIYIGGRFPGSPSYNKAVLVRYNKGIVDTFEVPYDSTVAPLYFEFDGPNSFFFSTTESFDVFRFDNGKFKRYALSEKAREGVFYRDVFGDLFLFRSRLGVTGFENILDCYKYSSARDSFEIFRSDRMYQDGSDIGDKLRKCGTELISVGFFTISYFNGTGWTKYITSKIPDVINLQLANINVGGTSRDSLFFYDDYGYFPFRQRGILAYTPNKWNFELSFVDLGLYLRGGAFFTYSDRVYVLFYYMDGSFLVTGKKKQVSTRQ